MNPLPLSISAVTKPYLRPKIQMLQKHLIRWYKHLYQQLEPEFRKKPIFDFILQRLKEWGITYKISNSQANIVVEISEPQAKPILAIWTDTNGLPIQQENLISHNSQPIGAMNACGYGQTVIALGTLYYLTRYQKDLVGSVKFIFKLPQKELEGSRQTIEEEILHSSNVDAIIGLHLWNKLPLGAVGAGNGSLIAAKDDFYCTILCRKEYETRTYQHTNSVLVSAQVVNTLQTIANLYMNPQEKLEIIISQLHAGIGFDNIADLAYLKGNVRYFNPSLKELIPQRIEQAIAGICQSYGANYKLDYWRSYPPVVNNHIIAEIVRSVAAFVVEIPVGITPEFQNIEYNDLSFFLETIPGSYFLLGCANPAKDLSYFHHNHQVDFDERVLGVGVEILSRCVEKISYLN